MGITVSVISVILKSVVGDTIGTGLIKELVDISIDEVSEKSISKINDFINVEKSKIEHILSKENMISMNIPDENTDYVVAEVKDLLSGINITDEVLRQCKYDSMNLSALLWNEYCEGKDGHIECENDIQKVLLVVAKALIKLFRESDTFEKEFLIQISNSVDDIDVDILKISNYMKENFNKLNTNNLNILNILLMILEQVQKINMQGNETKSIADGEKKFENDKKQDYIKNWNSRLFLHVDNDENPITLKDAFIMPDYEIHKSIQRVGFSENDTLDKIIDKFINYDKTSTMLIMGVPGIGKSSITSWIADKYKNDEKIMILRFRDWKRDELSNGLTLAVCNTLRCCDRDLNNKILVLDGFDEMKALDIRNELLDLFFDDMLDIDNMKCIITSRTNYINDKQFDNAIEIKTFSADKIIRFSFKISKKIFYERDILNTYNLEVLGVPVILYMALMSNIDISKRASKPELYSRIFAEQGGIFDRFAYEGIPYSEGKHILRNPTNIKKYLKFLCEAAFMMFEKNGSHLHYGEIQIPELAFEQKKVVSILEFPLKHLFEKTDTNIEFVHRSIYEYFVSEFILITIENSFEKFKNCEFNLAGVLGDILKSGFLSREILEFLEYKIPNSKLNSKFDIVNKAFQIMLQDGMTYHTHKSYKNVIRCERYIFRNMLKIIQLCENGYVQLNESAIYYINYINYDNYLTLDLRRVDLSNANLNGINFRNVNLSNANLKNTKLIDAILEGTDLMGADLSGADLSGANLKNAKLSGVIFEGANLSQVDLSGQFLDEVNFSKAILKRTNFKNSSLHGAIMTGAFMEDANFRFANIEGSVWMEEDIKSIYDKLKKTRFHSIAIIHQGEEKIVIKSELFPI